MSSFINRNNNNDLNNDLNNDSALRAMLSPLKRLRGIFKFTKRQGIFAILVILGVSLYFIYEIIYIPVRNWIKFRKYRKSDSESPEFICKRANKCKLDGTKGYLNGLSKKDNDTSFIISSSANKKLLPYIRLPRGTGDSDTIHITYSFLLYPESISAPSDDWVNTHVLSLTKFNNVNTDGNNIFNITMKKDTLGTKLLFTFQSNTTMTNINVNRWSHVVISFDNNIVDIYVNGKLEKSILLSNPSVNNTRDVSLHAGEKDTSKFPGKLMKLRYFKYSLTPLDVSLLYQHYKYTNLLYNDRIISSDTDRQQQECVPAEQFKNFSNIKTKISDYFNKHNDASKTRINATEYNKARVLNRNITKIESDYATMFSKI